MSVIRTEIDRQTGYKSKGYSAPHVTLIMIKG